MKAGVLALQGDFREHARAFAEAGATPVEVRTPADLDDVDCLAIPGGESTTIGEAGSRLRPGRAGPRARGRAGMPILGTCAGMIVLAREVHGGEPLFELMDITVRRNAYGRQVDSFEADLDVRGIDASGARGVHPRPVDRAGRRRRRGARDVRGPAGRPGAGHLLVASFHPELIGETGLCTATSWGRCSAMSGHSKWATISGRRKPPTRSGRTCTRSCCGRSRSRRGRAAATSRAT